MSVPDILANRSSIEGGFRTDIPEGWLQGRTAYGGLSAALAFEAAKGVADDLPPLRSAQVSFIGPLAGPVSVTATLERRGRNAAFISARVAGEAGIGLAATFVFMRAMDSHIAIAEGDCDVGMTPDAAETATALPGTAPAFLANFEGAFRPPEVPGRAAISRWFRLKDRSGLDPMTELVLMGDGLPPAAMAVMREPVPISSLTWIFNVLRPPETRDGWYFLSASSDHAEAGASSQDMSVWNADGRLVARGMQAIALFG